MRYLDIRSNGRSTIDNTDLPIRSPVHFHRDTRPRFPGKSLLARSAILIIAIFAVAPVGAVECGDTLGPGGRSKLTKDLVCDSGPAITVLSNTTFDLGGHTITSDPVDLTLIKVDGKNAKVRNGFLEDCGSCLVVSGEGHHVISRIIVRVGGASNGIVVSSNNNLLYRNAVTEADFGFWISGKRNRLAYNAADNNFGEGFVITGTKHLLFRNTADENVSSGFTVSGAYHRLIHNEVTGTRLENLSGFDINGKGHAIKANSATDNAGDGFLVRGQYHKLLRNIAEDNGGFGISVMGTNNRITRNVARDNGDDASSFDLGDEDLLCDNNIWKRNSFKTSNADCIK